MEQFSGPIEFEWDEGNNDKNSQKHGVSNHETEEAFTKGCIIIPDIKHSVYEDRQILFGKTSQGILLFVVFTLRIKKIRIISSRRANAKEKNGMKKKLKKLPRFKDEAEEARFWHTHSPLDYFDMSQATPVLFPNLKPTSRSISLRLPEYIINQVKIQANRLDVPYQSLMKQYIAKEAMKNSLPPFKEKD